MSPWISWLYVYGVGGLVFLAFVVIALRAGAVRLGHRPDRILLCVVAGGLIVFMTGHAVWIALVT
ncbi:MAG: hypothetical protein ACYSU7_15445 [Planctomycetota bacterium]|jgi:hypothetical protein